VSIVGLVAGADPIRTPEGDAIELVRVGYSYPNGVQAVDDISLAFPIGTITSIIGPSGCGKSTLLRMLAGLATPGSGSIRRSEQADGRLPVSMVFQDDVLLPWLTVRRNVALSNELRFGRRGKRHGAESEGADVDRLLSMVGLADFHSAHPAELSGGMRRRVGVLQALQPLPSVLLLDEPFSSVDEPTRIGIHQDVRVLLNQFGITGILVTHDLAEAISLADRVVLLSQRPASIVASYDIPFGTERDMRQLRDTDAFLTLYGTIWERLGEEIAAATAS